jgi:hypothetical protein
VSEPHVYTLQQPIEFAKKQITELTFRAPTAKDFRTFPIGANPSIGQALDVGSLLCGQPPVVMGLLSPPDMMEVVTIVMGFLSPGQPTGRTHSA